MADLVARVNAERILAGGGASFPEAKFTPQAGAQPPLPSDGAWLALREIAARIQARARTARSIGNELKSYHELMESYGELLHAFESSFIRLRKAAEASAGHLPSADQLETILSNVRVAYIVYTQTK